MALSYAFGGKGSDAVTQEDLKERRRRHGDIIAALAARPAQNVGEGLSAIGQALLARKMRSDIDRDATAFRERQADAWGGIVPDLLGGSSQPSPVAAALASPPAGVSKPDHGGLSPQSTGDDWLRYSNEGAIRNKPLNDKLVQAMSFLPEMGVSMEVFSGGQDAEGPHRTGSHRHDHGGAGDVYFQKDGRRLDWANDADRPIFEEIVRRGRAAGVTGFGAGEGYMRPGSMHLGFGSPSVWGAGGSGANAPEWLRNAYNGSEQPSQSSAVLDALARRGNPVQMASLDPSSGMGGYADPQGGAGVDAFGRTTAQRMGSQPPQAGSSAHLTMNAAAFDNHGNVSMEAPSIEQGLPTTTQDTTAPAAPMEVAQAEQGTYAPPVSPPDSRLYRLMQAAQNPDLSDEQRSLVGMFLKQELDRNAPIDPMKQLQMQELQQRIDKGNKPEPTKWEKLDDDTLFNPETSETKELATGPKLSDFGDTSALRKEIQGLPSYKNYSQAAPIYKSMVETAGRNSRASDLNLVYGLGKIMDPTSVVREGEMVMVKNTGSLPDWLQGAINSLNGGAALTAETRNAIMTEAYGRMKGYDEAFKQELPLYQHITRQRNIDPAEVIPNFGDLAPWQAMPVRAGQPSVDDLIRKYDR